MRGKSTSSRSPSRHSASALSINCAGIGSPLTAGSPYRPPGNEILTRLSTVLCMCFHGRRARSVRYVPMDLPDDVAELELYLLRHAHAGNSAAWDGPDSERPL